MSDLKNLRDLFATTYFRIPDFQRGYAWGARQREDLWDDLESLPVGMRHYMGTLFVEENFQQAESDRWVEDGKFVGVVDGQQRLTTLAILLSVLVQNAEGQGYARQSIEDLQRIYLFTRDRDHCDVKSYKFSYDEAGSSREYRDFLIGAIFEDPTISPPSLKSVYAKNLLEAKRFFGEKVSSLDRIGREALFKKVTTQLCFDYRMIDNDFDVQMVFETLNNRGKPLTVLEKLKNRLMYQAFRLSERDELKSRLSEEIKAVWGLIYEQLASGFDVPLDEDEFLAAHLSLYRRPQERVFSEKQAEEKLFRMFANCPQRFLRNSDPKEQMEPPMTFEKIDRYVRDLGAFLPLWTEIHSAKGTIQKILVLDSSREMKILLCAILACRGEPCSEDLLKMLWKIAFRNSIPGAGGKDQGAFASAARALYPRQETIDKMEKTFPETVLAEWRKEWNNPVRTDAVAAAFANLYSYQRGNKGFHRWARLKAFLFEYEESLVGNSHGRPPRVTLDQYAETSIEHVMPQTWEDHWSAEMADFLGQIPDDVRDDAKKTILNSLGNLTIIGARANPAVRNDAWTGTGGKKEFYAKEGTYSEAEIALNDAWNYKAILRRGAALLDFLADKLGCAHFTPEEKQTALLFKPDIFGSIDWDGQRAEEMIK